jgi:fructokinase
MARGALYGAIEAGGTKFVCAVGSGPDDLRGRIELPTTTPGETLERVLGFFEVQARREPLEAFGVASFGPIEVHLNSPGFGHITSTPKPGWQNVDLVGPLRRAFKLPVAFDTDVNAAALGERRWGRARGLNTFIYVTVGTGIGGGAMAEGRLLHGVLHPEMGHMRIAHDWRTDPFPGNCPFHGDCFEGLAAGPAIKARWGVSSRELPADHRAWDLEAHYMALGVVGMVCTLSPQRIIVGGGVMHQAGLYPMIRSKTLKLLNDYIRVPEIVERIDEYIVPPQLGDNAGVLGAIALALSAVEG